MEKEAGKADNRGHAQLEDNNRLQALDTGLGISPFVMGHCHEINIDLYLVGCTEIFFLGGRG